MNDRDQLVVDNMGFAAKVAWKYKKDAPRADIKDLVSAAYLGLIRAAEDYDEACNTAFTSYAVHWIKDSILEEVRRNYRIFRIPKDAFWRIKRMYDAHRKIVAKGGLLWDYKAVHKEVGVDIELCQMVVEGKLLRHRSLDAKVDRSKSRHRGRCLYDTIESSNDTLADIAQRETKDSVLGIINRQPFSKESKEAVIEFFGINRDDGFRYNLPEIASRKGAIRETVRSAKNKALRDLAGNPHLRRLFEELKEEG